MKIRVNRAKFVDAFQTAEPFAPKKSPKEVLQNVKLDASAQKVTLSATDTEVGICVSVDGVEVDKAGSIALPVSRVSSIIRESSDEYLSIDETKAGLVIRGERSEYKLPSVDVDEFPNVAEFVDQKYHVIPAALFRQIIQRTEYATDLESSRYALGGCLVELDASKIVMVGIDGRRLAKMEGPAESVGGHKTGDTMTIIRTQSLRLFLRSVLDSDGEVHLACHTNDVLLRTPGATFYSRLVEGRFPRWREVFPSRRGVQRIPFTVGPLHTALRQASVVASQDSRGVDFSFAAGTLTLMTSTADIGQAQVELPIAYDGPSITMTLDYRFVADFLKGHSPETSISLEIENGESAAVFWTDEEPCLRGRVRKYQAKNRERVRAAQRRRRLTPEFRDYHRDYEQQRRARLRGGAALSLIHI
jgi:DNA polymerase-3 subunit beta